MKQTQAGRKQWAAALAADAAAEMELDLYLKAAITKYVGKVVP